MSSQEWKKKNYNTKIRVSESTVAQLRKGTKASNIAKANKPGASAEYREAVRRFYGKSTVKESASTTKTSGRAAADSKRKQRVVSQRASRTAGKAMADRGPGRSYTKEYMDSKRSPKSSSPKKRQTILQKAGIDTTKIALTIVPTGASIKGIKTLAAARKYGPVVARNLTNMRKGYTIGTVTKGELKQAQNLADLVAKKKETLIKASKPTSKSAPKAKPAPKTKPKSTPKKADDTNVNEMSKKMLDRVVLKGQKHRKKKIIGIAAAGYGASQYRPVRESMENR